MIHLRRFDFALFMILFLVLGVLVTRCASREKAEPRAPQSGSPAVGASGSCAHTKESFRCVKYLSNYDGDTIKFEIPEVPAIIGNNMPIRLKGIDTPEVKSKNGCEKERGKEVKLWVEARLKSGKNIELVNCEREKYFRLLCSVQVDGQDLSQELLNKGYAYAYDGGTKSKVDWCKLPTPDRIPAQRSAVPSSRRGK